MNVATLLLDQVGARPDSPAIIQGAGRRTRVVSFGELDLHSARLAALLRRAGLVRGDVVLVLEPMSATLYLVLLALLRAGLVAMFVDPSAGAEHVRRACAMGRPLAMIGGPRAHLLRAVSAPLHRIPVALSTGHGLPGVPSIAIARTLEPWREVEPRGADDPALVTFTSGSTGEPKGAVRSHALLRAQHAALARHLRLASGRVDLTTLPMFVLANLASGVTSLIPDADLAAPGRIRPEPVIAQIREHRPSSTAASPALLERLAACCLARGETLEPLERVHVGGAPTFPGLIGRLARVMPRASVHVVYGSTEAEPIARITWSEVRPRDVTAMPAGRGLLVGRPVDEVEVAVLPDAFGRPIGPFDRKRFAALRRPAGASGEIVVHGDHVLTGYLGGRGDEETKFRVGSAVWHRTGDAGYLDDEGRLWLLGRAAARAEDARGTLYPFSVECAAACHPGVRRAALVAAAGRRVLAVELADSRDRRPLDDLGHTLAWASLDEICAVRSIPVDRRHNAKVDYPALARRLARR